MNITVEKQANCKATLKVEIPADKVKGQRQAIVSKYAGQARVPGFRPGKAPSNVIEKRYEKQITDELNENLFHLAVDEAIKKEDLKVLDFGAPQAASPSLRNSRSLPKSSCPNTRASRSKSRAKTFPRKLSKNNSSNSRSVSPISKTLKAAVPRWATSP